VYAAHLQDFVVVFLRELAVPFFGVWQRRHAESNLRDKRAGVARLHDRLRARALHGSLCAAKVNAESATRGESGTLYAPILRPRSREPYLCWRRGSKTAGGQRVYVRRNALGSMLHRETARTPSAEFELLQISRLFRWNTFFCSMSCFCGSEARLTNAATAASSCSRPLLFVNSGVFIHSEALRLPTGTTSADQRRGRQSTAPKSEDNLGTT
jgi:hypothetical protein